MDENAAKNTERYQSYKLQWMLDHGHTLEEIFRELYMIQKEYLEDGESCPSIWTLLDRWERILGLVENVGLALMNGWRMKVER